MRTVVFRLRVKSNVKPVDSHAGGTQPSWFLADLLAHGGSYLAPKGVLLRGGGAATEGSEMCVDVMLFNGARHNQRCIPAHIRERDHHVAWAKMLGEGVRVGPRIRETRAVGQDEVKGMREGVDGNRGRFPEEGFERCACQ